MHLLDIASPIMFDMLKNFWKDEVIYHMLSYSLCFFICTCDKIPFSHIYSEHFSFPFTTGVFLFVYIWFMFLDENIINLTIDPLVAFFMIFLPYLSSQRPAKSRCKWHQWMSTYDRIRAKWIPLRSTHHLLQLTYHQQSCGY